MLLSDACKMMQGIVDGLYTIEQLLYALNPPKEWSPRDQKLLSTSEIRMAWFSENMAGKSIGANKPVWVEHENVKRLGIAPRKSKHNQPSLFDILIGKLARKGIHIHYRPTLEKVYAADAEKYADKPNIKPAEIMARRAEIKEENENRQFYRSVNNRGFYKNKKRERKLSIARVMAEKENATQHAIDRYYLMLEDQRNQFPGLPAAYLPRSL